MKLYSGLIVVGLISIILIITGCIVPNAIAINVLISTGTSLLASAFFVLLTVRHIDKEKQRIALFEEMGLVQFYLERSHITQRCEQLFQDARQIDITGTRLKTLLENHKVTLTNLLLTRPVQIRILMPDPDADSAKTLQELLGMKKSIRQGLQDVLDWKESINKQLCKGTLELRFSDKMISSMYQRIDKIVFTGPYINKIETQRTYTLECDAYGKFGRIMADDFTKMFNEGTADIKNTSFVVEFLGMPGAGKTSSIELLKKKYREIYSHSNEEVACKPDDTPYLFNTHLLTSLSKILRDAGKNGVLFLDRGIEDVTIWLKVHKHLNNLSVQQARKLSNLIPRVPKNFRHYKILFLQHPSLSEERRPIERRVDEWALEKHALEVLYKYYSKRKSEDGIFETIDANRPWDEMTEQVMSVIERIYEIENNRF